MTVTAEIIAEWNAKAQCPEHLKAMVERRVAIFPATWRISLVGGEVFDSPILCFECLQAWAFIEGFAVIIRGNTGSNITPGKIYQYIHHDDNPLGGNRNKSKLEPRVQRSPMLGRVTSKRQRDTLTQARGFK